MSANSNHLGPPVNLLNSAKFNHRKFSNSGGGSSRNMDEMIFGQKSPLKSQNSPKPRRDSEVSSDSDQQVEIRREKSYNEHRKAL